MASGPEEIKRKPFSVRLSDEERAAIDAAAERAGLETGSYVRQVLMGAPVPRQMRRPQVERKELARILGHLGKIGGNLNQLAKANNQGLTVYHSEILVALGGVKFVGDAILRALDRQP